MLPVGTFLIFVGVVVIAAPELIAYFIGTLLILAGANLFVIGLAARKAAKAASGESRSSFRFGDYEIVRNRK